MTQQIYAYIYCLIRIMNNYICLHLNILKYQILKNSKWIKTNKWRIGLQKVMMTLQ